MLFAAYSSTPSELQVLFTLFPRITFGVINGLTPSAYKSAPDKIRKPFSIWYTFGVINGLTPSAYKSAPDKIRKPFSIWYTFGVINGLTPSAYKSAPDKIRKLILLQYNQVYATLLSLYR